MWAKEWTSPCFIDRLYSLSHESFYMADRMGLDSIMLHYLAVQQAMVSIHRPVHSKIMVAYTLTRQTNPGFFLEIKFKGGNCFCRERKYVKHSKNKQNLLLFWGKSKTFPPKGPEKTLNWPLTGAVHSREWLRSVTKCQGGLFLSFAQTSAHIVQINCQNRVPLMHGFVYCRLCH